jgi:hypothetical protein
MQSWIIVRSFKRVSGVKYKVVVMLWNQKVADLSQVDAMNYYGFGLGINFFGC